MELGRRSRERPTEGGQHLRPALSWPPPNPGPAPRPGGGLTPGNPGLGAASGGKVHGGEGDAKAVVLAVAGAKLRADGRHPKPCMRNHAVAPPHPTPAYPSRPAPAGTIPDPPSKSLGANTHSPRPHRFYAVLWLLPPSSSLPPVAESPTWAKCEPFCTITAVPSICTPQRPELGRT